MSTYVKDPTAILDYEVDWTAYLETGEAIATSTWLITGDDLLVKQSDTHDDSTATVWLAAGTDGRTYRVVNEITTTGNRTDARSITVTVADR